MCIFFSTSLICSSWSNLLFLILDCSDKKNIYREINPTPLNIDTFWHISIHFGMFHVFKPGALVNAEAKKKDNGQKRVLQVMYFKKIYILLSHTRHRFVSNVPVFLFIWLTANKDGWFESLTASPKHCSWPLVAGCSKTQAPPFRSIMEVSAAIWKEFHLNCCSSGGSGNALSTLVWLSQGDVCRDRRTSRLGRIKQNISTMIGYF